MVTLHYCPWVDAFQVEIWETLEAPPTKRHDIKVANLMGDRGSITKVKTFGPALADLDNLTQVALAFREYDVDEPFGYKIANAQWDNEYFRSYQVPNTQDPSSSQK
jgi:hypothetical protein